MSKEAFNPEVDLFDFDEDKMIDEELDLEGFDYVQEPSNENEVNNDSDNDSDNDSEEDEEDSDELNFDDDSEEDDDDSEEENDDENDDDDFDLEAFNKKLGTEYKTKSELKAALNLKEETSEDKKEEEELSNIEATLSMYEPIMRLSNEDIMRKQYESIAIQKQLDINDEDVQIDIEEKVQLLIDNGTLDLYAKDLRKEIEDKVLSPALEKKKEIETNRIQRENAKRKTEKENLQNAFADFYHTGNFYGIKPDKNKIAEVYKKASGSDFLQKISSDPKLKAELALFVEFKEEIFKKSTGLNYGDGMKAVLDEFKSKKDNVNVSRIQSKGGSVGSNKSEGLIADILYEAPKSDEERKPKV